MRAAAPSGGRGAAAPTWVELGLGPRQAGRLDGLSTLRIRTLPELLADTEGAEAVWLGGGEPTTRADLPEIIQAMAARGLDVGLLTDGLAFAAPGVARSLAGMGLRRLRIPLHSARPDAHDWLVGLPGATRRVVAAIRAAVEAGLWVEVEATLCRPTQDHPAETATLAAHTGARSFRLRWLRREGAAADDYVALAPRIGLLEGPLHALGLVAGARGLELSLPGIPRCAALRLPEALFTAGTEPGLPCGRCPGPPVCAGIPVGYVDRFGMIEAAPPERPKGSPQPARPTPPVMPVPPPTPVPPPPPRAGRGPATRLRSVHRVLERGDLGGDPLIVELGRPAPAIIRLVLEGSTREIRALLLRAAQEGAQTLRIADSTSLTHPALADLLRECTRLSFPRVEVGGPLHPLFELSDRQLLGLRGIHRFDHVFVDPPEEEALIGLGRLQRLTEAGVGLVRMVRTPEEASGEPGLPLGFRLAAEGGSLRELRGVMALQALLPCFLRDPSSGDPLLVARSATPSWALRPDRVRAPDPLDPDGAFTPCPSTSCPGPGSCPGIAAGWSA